MSRTFKDRSKKKELSNPKPDLKARYEKFKRLGPKEEYERCPLCGSFTDFHGVYTSCTQCNWTDMDEATELPWGVCA